MTTDADLLRIIAETLPAAQAAFAHAHLPRTAESPDIWKIVSPLAEAMDAHPQMSEMSSRFFLGKQLSFANYYQSLNLMQVAAARGPHGALAWYRAVREVRRTPMRVVGEVHGVLTLNPHRFSNGVTLMAASALPDSPNSAVLKKPISLGMRMDFPGAVTFEVDGVDAEDEHGAGHAHFSEIAAMLRRTVDAFVLADGVAPTVSTVWQEFADPELHAAEVGRIWMTSHHEV